MRESLIKVLAIPCTFAILLTVGCGQTDNKASQKTSVNSSDTATSTVATALPTSTPITTVNPVPTITAVTIDPKNFIGHETAGAMAVAMSNFLIKNVNESSDLAKLSNDKKSCLINSNHATSLKIFDTYLAKKLSADDLKKTNAFYSTELGQKLIVASDQKIKQQAGLAFANPVTLNDDDNAKLKAFSNTPEGKKLMTLFSPANQLEMQRDVIEPMMKAEFDQCEVKVVGVS